MSSEPAPEQPPQQASEELEKEKQQKQQQQDNQQDERKSGTNSVDPLVLARHKAVITAATTIQELLAAHHVRDTPQNLHSPDVVYHLFLRHISPWALRSAAADLEKRSGARLLQSLFFYNDYSELQKGQVLEPRMYVDVTGDEVDKVLALNGNHIADNANCYVEMLPGHVAAGVAEGRGRAGVWSYRRAVECLQCRGQANDRCGGRHLAHQCFHKSSMSQDAGAEAIRIHSAVWRHWPAPPHLELTIRDVQTRGQTVRSATDAIIKAIGASPADAPDIIHLVQFAPERPSNGANEFKQVANDSARPRSRTVDGCIWVIFKEGTAAWARKLIRRAREGEGLDLFQDGNLAHIIPNTLKPVRDADRRRYAQVSAGRRHDRDDGMPERGGPPPPPRAVSVDRGPRDFSAGRAAPLPPPPHHGAHAAYDRRDFGPLPPPPQQQQQHRYADDGYGPRRDFDERRRDFDDDDRRRAGAGGPSGYSAPPPPPINYRPADDRQYSAPPPPPPPPPPSAPYQQPPRDSPYGFQPVHSFHEQQVPPPRRDDYERRGDDDRYFARPPDPIQQDYQRGGDDYPRGGDERRGSHGYDQQRYHYDTRNGGL